MEKINKLYTNRFANLCINPVDLLDIDLQKMSLQRLMRKNVTKCSHDEITNNYWKGFFL